MTGINKRLLGAIMLLSIGVSCSTKSAQSPVNAVTRQQSAIDIKSRWEQQSQSLERIKLGKEYSGKRLDILAQILQEVPISQFNSEVERLRKEPADYDHMTEYDRYLLQAVFGLYAKQKNRDSLIHLLSAKCPRFIATSPVELEVASVEINQPFLILFDSYDAAIDGERRYLLTILRDSFKDLSKQYPNDQEFVSVSKSWYLANQSKVITNPYYHPLGLGTQRDLFVSKLP
jgi:hypothetical protein